MKKNLTYLQTTKNGQTGKMDNVQHAENYHKYNVKIDKTRNLNNVKMMKTILEQ